MSEKLIEALLHAAEVIDEAANIIRVIYPNVAANFVAEAMAVRKVIDVAKANAKDNKCQNVSLNTS